MPDFITFDELRSINQTIDQRAVLNEATRSRTGKNVFLSHSSKDAEFLPAVVRILEAHGASVYVDLEDGSLPEEPSGETAAILRAAINGCSRLVVFVTTNSKDSKWIPWELGVGDGEKGPHRVALFPAAQQTRDQKWANQEYLGLYGRIVWGPFKGKTESEWMVHNHHQNTADPLRYWLGASY